MADEQPSKTPAVDTGDETRHGDQQSREQAKDKMQSAIKGEDAPEDKPAAKPDLNLSTLEKVLVYSPYKVYFDGPANSVSAINDTGPFDILPGHKNFMTLLSDGDIVVRTDRGEEHIKTSSGIMHVSQNIVRVFLDV